MTVQLRLFKHLLPRARAWQITIDKKLRQFFTGLSGLPTDIREFIDLVWLDIFPETTRELDAWESQFGLPDTGLTTAERRTRLAGAWADTGGQSPSYIQNAIHAAGFTDVYIHDYWSAVVAGVPTVRDPNDYEAAGGYAIDNILTIGPQAPADLSGLTSADYPYFVYFGPETFTYPVTIDQRVEVDLSRKRELETLMLKLCPQHLWIMAFIQYTTADAFQFAEGDVQQIDTARGWADDARTTGGKWIDK